MSYRFAALCVAAIATQAFAENSAIGREVRLECPVGTVQKGERVSKDMGVFCVKVGSTPQDVARHGPYVDFWANGKKQSEGQYKDGFRSGHWTFYDANGVKTGETQFENNDYHGKRVEFHPNGAKKLEQSWVKGKREGVEATYTEDGQKASEVRYLADKPLASK
ncbi:toxin-antitoxin system YwqK family antitoxin [Myxococcus sp. CA039A]|uniref:toxin-antitoxin system YwqK family antitoxin n=1 Tax=Myxococcus sp. CA039A TaxID=2741737 RepID=UPI00157A7239|nr:hypothetical protein [Myxococcus sp. CA039A]NTX52444.1 hypothetical protein [Myxococcus sp. CA039A]